MESAYDVRILEPIQKFCRRSKDSGLIEEAHVRIIEMKFNKQEAISSPFRKLLNRSAEC